MDQQLGMLPIPPFNLYEDTSNLSLRWEKWLNRFENYIIAANVTTDERKLALLLHLAGEQVHELYLTLPDIVRDPPEMPIPTDYVIAKRKLNAYFTPSVNKEVERFTFRQAKQEPGETTDQFYGRLLKLSKTCAFNDVNAEIKSQLIMGTNNKRLQEYGLTDEVSLENFLNKARTLESTAKQIKQIGSTSQEDKQCNRIKQRKSRTTNDKYKNKNHNSQNNTCRNCGQPWHEGGRQNCPARSATCRGCGKQGHYARVCMQQNNNRPHQSQNNKTQKHKTNATNTQRQGNNQPETDSENEQSESSFRLHNTVNKKKETPLVNIKTDNTQITWLIDTGSSLNIISKATFDKMENQTLAPTSTKIHAYNSSESLKVLGKFNAKLEHNDKRLHTNIYVTEGRGESLLSCNTAQQLGLVRFTTNFCKSESVLEQTIREKFPKLCKGIGKYKGPPIKLHIDKSKSPIANKHRRIPINMRDKVATELARLEKDDIIEKVIDGPTPWVSPIVLVPRAHDPTKIRLCVDMRQPNTAILRERHITPTINEIIADLNGSKVFSKIDLKHGYHQLVLDESSRYVTTFSTHLGLYRYKRLSFGINSASEIFQNTIRQILSNIVGAINYSDDILVFGINQREHDKTLNAVLETLNNCNLTINLEKCMFSQNSINFLGYIFSESGVKADPEKIQAVVNLEAPKNIHEVRSLLGMLNYIGRFIPDLATNTTPIRQLLLTKTPTEFHWSEEQERAFQKLKDQLARTHTLAYYDPKKEIHLIVDASPTDL